LSKNNQLSLPKRESNTGAGGSYYTKTEKRLNLGKLTNQRKKEKMKVAANQSKQSTLDIMSLQFNIPRVTAATKPIKEIMINTVEYAVNEDELALKIGFSFLPSKDAFSKVHLDLFFQDVLITSTVLRIPQSSLLHDSFEYPLILDMKGIEAGKYLLNVEMYELWSYSEKLNFASKQIVINYVPKTRESRYRKVPTIKTVAGNDLTVVSSSAKNIFDELEQNQKKEEISKRDEW